MYRSPHVLLVMMLTIAGCSAATGDGTSPPSTKVSTTTEQPLEESLPTDSTARPTTTSELAADDRGLYRLAEIGPDLPELLLWDETTIRNSEVDSEKSTPSDGRFIELVDVPEHGIAFQIEDQESTIWLHNGDAAPTELVVGTKQQRLELEGAGRNAQGEVLVFYQRHVGSTPPTRESTLRSFNLDTNEVQELVGTGGWESGSDFSHIRGGVVVANWGDSGSRATWFVDTAESRYVNPWDNTDPATTACDCPVYLHATIVDGVIYGVTESQSDGIGADNKIGLYTYDPETNKEEPISTLQWDRGLGYPEDLFEFEGHLIMSFADGEGRPLPAVVWSLDDGTAWTLPEPGFARPPADF